MDTFDAISQRRAVKHYDANHKLTDAEVNKLFGAAIQSPTSFNMQNWRFVLVTDPDLRAKLRAAAFDQVQVTDASLLVVVTADLDSFKKDPERYWRAAPKEVAGTMVGMMVPFYEGNEQLKRDEAMRSMGIAAQTLMLAAKDMGYDSCPMIGFDSKKVAQLIDLPGDHVIGLLLVVGKAIKPAWAKPGQLPLEEVIVSNKFQ